jgi:hypothetical protein
VRRNAALNFEAARLQVSSTGMMDGENNGEVWTTYDEDLA